ncbi:adenosylmethionine decarboxylase [Aquincola tertiaricarbonis]|uniref:Adenosylmethionine decarboxylase n=1 Tax=Aquincola tertiaricarbonis TaxID=391953 RepID=A0ABY4SDA6_AQUTE|nr:adenosylmethionine decarboxylase [Aquincola tertiaricarbonis]URI10464.1 adenosylmethionine decarboxylase [Aquincola tertiaricarbonis]
MHGLHLTADLQGCPAHAPAMTEREALRSRCLALVADAGLHAVGEVFHGFAPQGLTGVVLLAESHLAVHTWPELGAVTLDVYVCNVGADHTAGARRLLAALIDLFQPAQVLHQQLQRGDLRAPPLPT